MSRANGDEDGDGLGTVAAAIYSDANLHGEIGAREMRINQRKLRDANGTRSYEMMIPAG